MPSLSPEVSRADADARAAYQEELLRLVEAVTAGLPPERGERERRDAAWSLLAQLAGGVILARAVADQELATEIATAVRAGLK